MRASLPMYDWPEVAAETDALWEGIHAVLSAAGIEALRHRERPDDLMAHWLAPDLVLSQTCGLPYRARLQGKVHLVGTTDYGLPGLPPGYYQSVLIAHRKDPRDRPPEDPSARCAVNDPLSQSGWAAAVDWARANDLPLTVGPMTGSHAASLAAVADGAADWAALDAVSWRYLEAQDPNASAVRVFARTTPTPGLPLITALRHDPAVIAAAVGTAITALPGAIRGALGLHGLVAIPSEIYCALPLPEPPDSAAFGGKSTGAATKES